VCVHFAANLHAGGIKLPLPVPCKSFPGILMTTTRCKRRMPGENSLN
jgi:hypothetical protein